MICPNCHSTCEEEETYCRYCGADLTVTSVDIVPVQRNLPALFAHPQLPRSVAASVGAVALGVGLELLRRGVLARLSRPPRSVGSALPILNGLKDILMPQNNKPLKPPRGYEIEETVVYMRRVIRRQSSYDY
jgi:hypothetical protein